MQGPGSNPVYQKKKKKRVMLTGVHGARVKETKKRKF